MRNYSIYLIEEEFASHYFGRESIIFNLFLDYKRTSFDNKTLLSKQIEFITRPIPTLKLHQILETTLSNSPSYHHFGNSHFMQINAPESEAMIKIFDRHIRIEATGGYEAETVFFEILRKYDSCFLAMEFHLDRYGWLNPIKQRNFV